MAGTMSSSMNSSWFAASRRRLAAALCVLMLLAGLLPAHAVAQAVSSDLGQTSVFVVQTDGEAPAVPDAVPGHVACHCACKIATLPGTMMLQTSFLVRPAPFVAWPSQILRPGALEPLAEPPRT